MTLPARPIDAVPLFERLAQWGEVSVYEAEELDVAPWLSVFEGAGALTAMTDDQGRPLAWHLGPSYIHLLEHDAQQVGRRLFFAVPAYRAYLLGVLVEGLVDASHAGMTREVEEWTGTELAALLPELNALFEGLESDMRLVDLTPAELESRTATLPERAQAFESWDRFALGQTARPKALFEFALRRFAPAAGPLPVVAESAAVLRPLPLNQQDGFSFDAASRPAAWNTQRLGVLGGVATFDTLGRPLFCEDAQVAQAPVEHLQDALVRHPFYAAVVHLAISAWRSPASTMPAVELFVPSAGNLHDASLLVGSRGVGRLADLLGDLVRAQGCAPFGLVEGRVPDALLGNLLRNLLELRMLEHRDGLLVLDGDYQSSLMATRLRTVFRPGKELQKRMVEHLAARPNLGGAA